MMMSPTYLTAEYYYTPTNALIVYHILI